MLTSSHKGQALAYSSLIKKCPDFSLEWHGWASTVGIAALTYTGDYVVNDGLQANAVVPEPGTLTLTGIGLLGLFSYGWQHRKRTA